MNYGWFASSYTYWMGTHVIDTCLLYMKKINSCTILGGELYIYIWGKNISDIQKWLHVLNRHVLQWTKSSEG